jgi:heme-degrading monooxygenase HmoA
MIVVVFRSRLHPDAVEAYAPMAVRMSKIAKEVPGYVSHKAFIAADGERVTIVEFESETALQIWRVNREHIEAKKHGFNEFFIEFSYHICSVMRSKNWKYK